jgi:LysM repeat protein
MARRHPEDRPGRRNPARYLAPVALVAAILGTYLVVEHGLSPPSAHHAAVSVPSPSPSPTKRRYARARFYVVRPGDNLTSISVRTGVPVGAIQSLNPHLVPDSLHPGQRLRIRR